MFEASLKTKSKPIRRGQTVEGSIVAIGAKVAFVNVGGKGEAMIDIAELKNEDGTIGVKVGDRIQAVVTSTEGGLTLSRKLARGAATNTQLEAAYRSRLTVEGKVEKEVKGGYEVRIGGSRAFCPFSQIDIARNTTAAQHLGRAYEFRITEYAEGGRNVVVSRRALLEEEQRAAADEIRKSIVPGAVLTGRVASVRDFGAFVDLGGGVQGLLHVSEMSWSRVDPAAVVETGQQITVKVLRVDEDGRKIALGLKQLLDDPWSAVPVKYEAGKTATGRVTRHAEFGAFVELEPGVEALMPASETGVARRDEIKKALPVGTGVEVIVLEVDAPARRMRVSRKAVVDAREASEVREYTERADAAPERMGSLADQLTNALKKP